MATRSPAGFAETEAIMKKSQRLPIVHDQRFIVATRDTGYKSTASAVSELVDNAIQARARNIRILVTQEGVGVRRAIRVAVLDDGTGMDRATLREALQFGGSTRFDDRTGPGRFGMGLPNSSVSQSKRLEVYSWQKPEYASFSYLDVDEIAAGKMRSVPNPVRKGLPEWASKHVKKKPGTLVVWDQCDRLDNRKASTIAAKLATPLGRRFRHFIWEGIRIWVNNERVIAVDPLFLQNGSNGDMAVMYGDPLNYEVRVPRDPSRTSVVTVRFTELPITKWHDLPTDEKRRRMIAKGAGVSVVRASREIAYGWYFMGGKRKENYDDWWRCEIHFEPELDECFGVTHSKQEINPTEEIRSILTPDLEAIGHSLNARARAAYSQVRSSKEHEARSAAKVAATQERYLPPVACQDGAASRNGSPQKGKAKAANRRLKSHDAGVPGVRYRIDTADLRSPDFYTWCEARDGTVVVTLNKRHPFFEQVYARTQDSDDMRFALETLLLAAVRAERTASKKAEIVWNEKHRVAWSDALAAFLGD